MSASSLHVKCFFHQRFNNILIIHGLAGSASSRLQLFHHYLLPVSIQDLAPRSQPGHPWQTLRTAWARARGYQGLTSTMETAASFMYSIIKSW